MDHEEEVVAVPMSMRLMRVMQLIAVVAASEDAESAAACKRMEALATSVYVQQFVNTRPVRDFILFITTLLMFLSSTIEGSSNDSATDRTPN